MLRTDSFEREEEKVMNWELEPGGIRAVVASFSMVEKCMVLAFHHGNKGTHVKIKRNLKKLSYTTYKEEQVVNSFLLVSGKTTEDG